MMNKLNEITKISDQFNVDLYKSVPKEQIREYNKFNTIAYKWNFQNTTDKKIYISM